MRDWLRRATAARAALLLLILGALAWLAFGRGDGGWGRVVADELVPSVPIVGNLESVEAARIGPPPVPRIYSFKVAFMISEGTQVTEGERILAFDASELQRSLLEKRLEREQAEKELEKRRRELEQRRNELSLRLAEAEGQLRLTRLKLDRPSEIAAARELRKHHLDLSLAEKEVEYLRARLRLLQRQERVELGAVDRKRARAAARVAEIEEQVAAMSISAPRAGTVVYIADWGGEKVSVGDSVWRGAQVLEIPDLETLRAAGEVAEVDMGRLAPGQEAVLTLDALPDLALRGRIVEIARSVARRSDSDPGRVAQVRLALETDEVERLRPGMRFRGRVLLARAEEALLAPLAAVEPTADGPEVLRRTLLGARAVRPKLGRVVNDRVEVMSGLEEGDLLLLPAGGAEGR